MGTVAISGGANVSDENVPGAMILQVSEPSDLVDGQPTAWAGVFRKVIGVAGGSGNYKVTVVCATVE